MNPYVAQLTEELRGVMHLAYGGNRPDSPEDEVLALHVAEALIAPKNKKIHDLHAELAHMKSDLARLEKVLATHNAGVCKDHEHPIDCAIRLLSPIPDDMPARDRP